MRVAIAGGTGLIGSALTKRLVESGHQVIILTRSKVVDSAANITYLQWDGKSAGELAQQLEGIDAIVNLAGASIGGGLWTAKRKVILRESRLQPGKALTDAVSQMVTKPQVFIQVSGIGIYGDTGETAVKENTPAGSDFLAKLAVEWENSTRAVESFGVRRVIIRPGIVLASQGGILNLISLPFKLFVGGPIGSGKQWWPWIHIDDLAQAVLHLIVHKGAHGAFNLVSEKPARMDSFGRSLGKAIKRPYWFPTPAFLLRTVLGEMSILVLAGQKAVPDKLKETGFKFQYPDIASALEQIYSHNR